MQKITTRDGSVTFRSVEVGECYHTQSGAVEEAFEKFARPCKVDELAKTGKVIIFDVCFGLGYNSAAAIDVIKKTYPKCEIIIYGFENDQKILDKILEVNPKFESYDMIKKVSKSHELDENKGNLKIILGAAKKESNYFHRE